MAAHILVVDDSALNLVLMVHVLEARGFVVQSAPDAETALEMLPLQRPDLILLDMQMPGMDGFELASRLKADAATASIPIIAVTAYALPADRQRALAAGCDEHVAKPIDTRTFPGFVDAFLADRGGPTAGSGRCG